MFTPRSLPPAIAFPLPGDIGGQRLMRLPVGYLVAVLNALPPASRDELGGSRVVGAIGVQQPQSTSRQAPVSAVLGGPHERPGIGPPRAVGQLLDRGVV
jgi:hypothetical protein